MPKNNAENEPGIILKSVVIATDFLESSRLALDYAVAFARHFGARLTLVHAFELSSEAREVEARGNRSSLSREHALTRLEALAAAIRRSGMSADIDLREGEACAAVLTSASDNQADLLVLGSHGIYRGLEHMLIGSNAEKILLSAQCPTLTVGKNVLAGIDLDLNFKKIVFISDMSPESISAAEYAVTLGKQLDVESEILQLAPDAADFDQQRLDSDLEKYCVELGHLSAFANHEWLNPAYHLQRMTSAKDVLQQAVKCEDGLFVLGVHNESRWKRHMHASFAFELIAKASSPLLSIHAKSH